MRSSPAVPVVQARSALRLSRRAIGATALCLGSAASAATAESETARPDGDGAAAPRLETITVTGVRPLLDDKLPGKLRDTPQSVTVVTQQLLKAQATTRLEDALKNVPGITLNAGEGAARGDTVNLRGFSAFNDFFLDGIRDAAVYSRDSFDTEKVEVLKGPSAVLFGRGSTGGAINQVSKAPRLAPLRAGTLQVGTNNALRATADFNEPIGPDAALRLNAMGETSEVTDRDFIKNRRWGFAPSLALGISEPNSLTLAYLHQEENNVPDTGIPFVNGQPSPVKRNAYYGLKSDRTTANDDIVTVRLKHDFTENLSVANTFRYADYGFDYHFSAPNFGKSVPGPTTPLGQILVGRDAPASAGVQTNLTDQIDLTARFETGPVSHVLVAGLEIARQTSDIGRYNNPFNRNNDWVPRTPLLNPNGDAVPPVQPISSQQNTSALSQAAYLTDTIHIGPYIDVIGGLRFDRFAASYDQTTLATGAYLNLRRADNVPSPRAAIVIKPTATQSYYFSYGTSFDPSAEALALTAKTAALGPVKAKSYEAGVKTDWLGGMLSVNAAVFRTEVDNAQTNDPDNPTITTLAGNQRVDGLEIGVTGYVTENWEIFAGYTYLDAKTVASGTTANIGKFLPNTARNAINLWTGYDIDDDWKIGGGVNWLGHRFADTGNQANLPSYVTVDAMISYRVNDRVTVQVNGRNLFDTTYYDAAYYTSPAENHVIPGPGRTFTVTASFGF